MQRPCIPWPELATAIKACVAETRGQSSRLVLVANLSDQEVADAFDCLHHAEGWPVVALGHALASALAGIAGDDLPHRLRDGMDAVIDGTAAKVVLVRRIEVLYAPVLKAHPVRQLAARARNRTVVAHWPGTYAPASPAAAAPRLTYAEPGHPEWFDDDATGLAVVYLHHDGWNPRLARTTAPTE